jgi:glyoxylase-like metal-dependent hydrolase (beta-lactamase superfamily II)
VTVSAEATENRSSTSGNPLSWMTRVTPEIPAISPAEPTGAQHSPMTSTLIYGSRDAVLIDAWLTIDQGRDLADWVAHSGKRLTTIYITHGHADHFFGASILLDRFPQARLLALPSVIEVMRQQSAAGPQGFWRTRFPGQIPDRIPSAEPFDVGQFELEGHALNIIPAGHTDTENTSFLFVPHLKLAISGDVTYNGVHVWLGETTPDSRRAWIASLDHLESLNPLAVVSGHKQPGNTDDPRVIDETRQYIRNFDRLELTTQSGEDLYEQMLVLYPTYANPSALWLGAHTVKRG